LFSLWIVCVGDLFTTNVVFSMPSVYLFLSHGPANRSKQICNLKLT
jgi:hypothetical protein